MHIELFMTDEETRYNNRQIERMIDENKQAIIAQSVELKQHVTDTIKPFLTLLTNLDGRTTELELKRAAQGGYNRAMAVAGTVGFTVVLALSGWALYQVANIGKTVHAQLQDTVQNAVQEALSPYNLKK